MLVLGQGDRLVVGDERLKAIERVDVVVALLGRTEARPAQRLVVARGELPAQILCLRTVQVAALTAARGLAFMTTM